MKKNTWKRIQKPKPGYLNFNVSRTYKAPDGEYEVSLYRYIPKSGDEFLKGWVINVCGVTNGIRNKSRWIKSGNISMAQADACFQTITYSQM